MSVRRLLAAALVAAIAVVGLVAQPAVAATASPTLTVAPNGGGIIRDDRGLGVRVTVSNPGTTALPKGRLTFSLDDAPVANSGLLLSSIATPPEQLQGKLASAEADVPVLDAGASREVRVTLGEKDLALLTGTSGARRIYVQYQPTGGARKVAVSSIVKIAKGSTAQVGFGAVIPVLAPAGTTGVVDTATQLELTGPEGAWSQALRAAESSPSATIALDPAVIASIRLAGDAAPPEATGFLDELSRLPNETIRLPYADGDVTLERAAGVPKTIAPSSFAGVLLPTIVTDGSTPTPTATTGTVSTSVADLTAWNWSDQTVGWPVPHTAGTADLSMLGTAGATVLLPSDDIADTPVRKTVGPFATVGGTKVLVADATASSLLATAVAGGTRGDAALATLTGVLATAAVSGEATAMLATIARTTDPARLDRVLSIIDRQSWVRGRSLTQLATGTPTAVQLRPHAVSASRVGVARSLLAGERRVRELGNAITTGADTVTAPERLALLGALSSSWRGDDTGWLTATSAVTGGFSEVLDEVQLPPQSPPNFIGSDGTLRAYVTNDLPVPVTVVIHASASNGAVQFTGTADVTVTVPARSQARGELGVRTIRNGSTDLTLRLTTPGGVAIDTLVAEGATVRAGFDTIIAIGLLSALGLLLALGVYRNVKRRRQPRAVTP